MESIIENIELFGISLSRNENNTFLPSRTEAYARQMWIADLMEAANFKYISTDIISSFIDVDIDNPYSNAIEMALNNRKIITKDEIGTIVENGVEKEGPVFHPEDSTTREFAIETALKALGYMDIDTSEKQYNLALEIGLLDEKKNGTTFTTEEAKGMLKVIKNMSKVPEYGEEIVSSVDIKDNVIKLTQKDLEGKGYQFKDDNGKEGKLELPNIEKTKILKKGDIIILPQNREFERGLVQKIESVENIQNERVILTTSEAEFLDVLGEDGMMIRGTVQAEYTNFIPSDSFDIIYDGVENTRNTLEEKKPRLDIAKGDFGTIKIKSNRIEIEFKNSTESKLSGTIEYYFPKIGLDIDINPGFMGIGSEVQKMNVSVENNCTVGGSVTIN